MIDFPDVDSLVTGQILKATNKALNKLAKLRKDLPGWDAFWLINNDGSGTIYYFRDGEEEFRQCRFREIDNLPGAVDTVRALIHEEELIR